jgi:hypothetical protein
LWQLLHNAAIFFNNPAQLGVDSARRPTMRLIATPMR